MDQPFGEQRLPPEVLAAASLHGNEYAWTLSQVESVVRAGQRIGLAVVGGNAQFRVPEGICDLYWVEADAPPRRVGEPWNEYVVRGGEGFIERFRELRANTNFVRQGTQFDILKEKDEAGVDLNSHLYFTLYFDPERGSQEAISKDRDG